MPPRSGLLASTAFGGKQKKISLAAWRDTETAWSLSGQLTGLTDLALTEHGEQQASLLGERLSKLQFSEVLTSPLRRANRTCELAGFGTAERVDADLVEWDYGKYEGLRRAEILKGRPAWKLFCDGCPGGGESPEQVAARADRSVERIRAVNGNVLICSSGHFLRVLAARWLGLNRFTAETSCSPPQASACWALRGNRVGIDRPVGGSVPVEARFRNRNYLAVVTESIFELSALSPLAVTFTPPSMASYVEVALVIGTRPELVSVSRCCILEVPSVLSAPNAMVAMASIAQIMSRTHLIWQAPFSGVLYLSLNIKHGH